MGVYFEPSREGRVACSRHLNDCVEAIQLQCSAGSGSNLQQLVMNHEKTLIDRCFSNQLLEQCY